MKIAINRCYGGFHLSPEAVEMMSARKGKKMSEWDQYVRNDKDLIEVIETLGSEKASGSFASLKIVEIPDDVEWEIDEHDGAEMVVEKRRTWC